MKTKKVFAACLALLMLLSLAPAALAAELPFSSDIFQGVGGGFTLKSMISDDRDHIDLAGSSVQLENILFAEECVVDEDLEFCVCETNDSAMLLDETALPPGCRIELRKERVRIPDARTGAEIAEEMRLEKLGRKPEPKTEDDIPDRDRETTYLYLVGRPAQTGYFTFILWDGSIRLVEVEVLSEKPDHPDEPVQTREPAPTETPVVTEEWVDPFASGGEQPVNQEWTDPSIPATLPPVETAPQTPPFVLPTPSVTVRGFAAVEQGQSVLLEAEVSNSYNPTYQWYVWDDPAQQWRELTGETDAGYRPDTASAGSLAYLCEVTNHGPDGQTAAAYSEPGIVQVTAKQELPTPTVTGVTGETRVELGENAVLEVHATDTFNASYQWYEARNDWTAISGATGSQYRPDTSEAGTQTYLVQVTNSGYGQTTTAYSEPVTFTVEAKPALPTPSVIIAGSDRATVGETVQLEARVTNGRNVRYQWYASLGYYDAPVQTADAVSASFRPDTSKVGTYTYFCEVTSSEGGETVTVKSDPVTLTVSEKQVTNVTVDTLPSKVSYYDGERLDTTGLRLLVWYNDGSYERVTTGFTAEPSVVSYGNNGSAEATIRYQGYNVYIPLTVTQRQTKTIRSVEIDTKPTKLSYNDGERLDTTGLRLLVKYTDGSYELVTDGFTAGPTTVNYNNTSTANVAVRYQGYTLTYQISVRSQQQAAADMVKSIGILTMPNKTSYTVGESLNTAGLMIRAYSYDGRTLDVGEGFTCSPTYFSSIGNQTVTVSFLGKTTYFTVNVTEARRVYGLTIQSMPSNRSYTVGDTINAAGLVLQLQTNSGYETVTSGYSISPRVASGVGTQMVTVSYEGLTANYNIEVRESNIPRVSATPAPTLLPYTAFQSSPSPAPSGYPAPSASPAPGVTPVPGVSASPAPSATPRPVVTPTPARRNTGVSTLVKVLFVVAVLALAGLIGYLVYLKMHGDVEDDVPREPSPSEKLHNFFSKKDKDGK